MGKHPSLTIALITLLAVGTLVFLLRPERHNLKIRCYFQNANGLRTGAQVRLAGVEVGSVTSVRALTERPDHPAEVEIFLQTPYVLKIPNDAIVTIESAGLLGEQFAEIDIRNASGAPIENEGTLKTGPPEGPSSQQLLECLANIAEHKPCDLLSKHAK